MSKRTWGGPTLVQNKRCCFEPVPFEPVPVDTGASCEPPPTSNKRKREFEDQIQKRQRSINEKRGTKRPACLDSDCFDSELEHLEKRMRASMPTATEAIAFLIPHMLKLRNLYSASQQKVDDLQLTNSKLEASNLELKKNVVKVGSFYMSENARLKSELELARYRLQMFGPKPRRDF